MIFTVGFLYFTIMLITLRYYIICYMYFRLYKELLRILIHL